MVSKQYLIIGAGVSGLTLAYELAKKGNSVRIFEKNKLVGGLARTEVINGIHFDCGPHLFHSNREEIKEYWKNLLGDLISTPDLYGANFIDGKVYEYPLSRESIKNQFNLNEIEIINSQLANRDLSQLGSTASYDEYVKCLAGPFLANKFFKKYPEKLWGISTDFLSAKFAPRRVEIRDESRAFHSGEGKWAAVLSGGCGTLSNELEKRLNRLGVNIEYGMTLTDLNLNHEAKTILGLGFNNEDIVVDASNALVISTAPVTSTASLLGIPHQLWYRSLKIISVLINRQVHLPGGYDWLYFDSEKTTFHRITLQNSFSTDGIPDGKSIISCEVAYSDGDQVSKMPNDVLVEKCISQLIELGMLASSDVETSHYMDAGYVYPGISLGYEIELAKLTSRIDEIQNLYRHGALAEFEYSDLQVLTAKSIDLANVLSDSQLNKSGLVKRRQIAPGDTIKINGRPIGSSFPAYIIAEAGLNHNGDLELAKRLVLEAKKAGADAVKFQTYAASRISKAVRTSAYYEDLVDTQESLSDFLDRVRLSDKDLINLFEYAAEIGITIFSTPFDIDSFIQLESLNVPAYKISSMDIVNLPLIKTVAASMKPVIISTGMSTVSNIEEAMATALSTGNPNILLLHCVSAYPCPASIANLTRMQRLKELFSVVIGFSDHTTGVDISLAAVAMGASVIEKHFTLDRKLDGPDHNFSLLPEELNQLVVSSKRIFEARVDQGLSINNSEINSALNLRRSLFYSKNLKKGDILTEDSLVIRSPGVGLHPRYMDEIIGGRLNADVYQDHPVNFTHFINK